MKQVQKYLYDNGIDMAKAAAFYATIGGLALLSRAPQEEKELRTNSARSFAVFDWEDGGKVHRGARESPQNKPRGNYAPGYTRYAYGPGYMDSMDKHASGPDCDDGSDAYGSECFEFLN